jgi:hypothetical protein
MENVEMNLCYVLKKDNNSNSFLGFIFFASLILVLVMVELIGLNGLTGRKNPVI